MTNVQKQEVREPLIHLSKRASIPPLKAWGIRLLAIALGLIVCGLVAFLLIEKLEMLRQYVPSLMENIDSLKNQALELIDLLGIK